MTAPGQQFYAIKKILLIKLKNIGDVLLCTPCIRTLKEAFPEASISALVNEGTSEMLEGHPLLSEIFVYPRSRMKQGVIRRMGGEWRFASSIKARKFDLVVDLTSGDRGAWLGWWIGARYRIAYDPMGAGFFGKKYFYTHVVPLPMGGRLHEVRKNLGVLEGVGMKSENPLLELHVSQADRDSIVRRLQDERIQNGTYVVAHPTSRWLFKCWDDARFAAVLDRIHEKWKCKVILTSGPDQQERKRADRVYDLCRSKPLKMLGELTLKQWAALVHGARFFFGVDSAPMHIAASQGTPTLALFGPTGHENWHPWGVSHRVVVHDCPCAKDRQPHCDWKKIRACMMAITEDEVWEAMEALWNETTTDGESLKTR